jgi:mono/diheme cytochrome c family protein
MSDKGQSKQKDQRPKRRSLAFGRWTLDSLGSASRQALHVALLTVTTTGLSGCEWFTDFKRQPHVVTWESWRTDTLGVRGSPQGSVPMDGTAVPAWMVSYSPAIATIDSMAGIANPVPVTEASLAAGRMQYQINCSVCHGDNADGMGAATRFGFPAISLQNEIAKARTDGYVFGMIRNGRGLMPPYNRIEERDRWDLINYLRALQGRVTGVPFERGPMALPGVTGDKVPGASTLGPARAVPHRPSAPDTARGGDGA